MANIITRAGKGAPLSWNEADANFTNLNNDKVETSILANYSTTVETDASIAAALAVHTNDAIDAHVSSAIGYLPAGTGAVVTDVQTKLHEFVSIKDFGAVGDGIVDDTAALQAARLHIELTGEALYFPSGVYKYTTTINWNVPYLRLIVEGKVRFRYTGTGNAFVIDDSSLVGLYGLYIGPNPIIIEAPTTAQNGVFLKGVHHSELHFNVRGAGATYAGMRIEFAVCSSFPNFTVSNNENGGVQGWYLAAKPKYGIYLTERNPGETASYCMFNNPILEGTEIGAYLDKAMGNIFVGGTMEGCTDKGAYLAAGAFANKWYGTDFEANVVHDIYCLGRQNQFSDIDTLYLLTFDGTAHDNRVLGGNHNQISLTAATYANQVGNLVVNRNAAGGTVTDSGSSNRLYNIRDATLGLNYNRPPTASTAVPGASPWTYTNTSAQNVDIAVGGGVVSQILYKRPSTGSVIFIGTIGKWKLCPGDEVEITYSVAPTVVIYSD